MGPSTAARTDVHVRWMIRRDMPGVLRAEQESFEYAWTEEDFLRCLRQRNCIGMVAEQGEKVAGFTIFELHPRGLEVLNLGVDPARRRQGVGAAMVRKMAGKLAPHRRLWLAALVGEWNLPAQLFFRSQGWRAVRVLRGYYADTDQDAYRMEYRLGGW